MAMMNDVMDDVKKQTIPMPALMAARLIAAGMDDTSDLEKLAVKDPKLTEEWLRILPALSGINNPGGFLRRKLERGEAPTDRQRAQVEERRREAKKESEPLRIREPEPAESMAWMSEAVRAEAEERLRATNAYVYEMKPGHVRNAVLNAIARQILTDRGEIVSDTPA